MWKHPYSPSDSTHLCPHPITRFYSFPLICSHCPIHHHHHLQIFLILFTFPCPIHHKSLGSSHPCHLTLLSTLSISISPYLYLCICYLDFIIFPCTIPHLVSSVNLHRIIHIIHEALSLSVPGTKDNFNSLKEPKAIRVFSMLRK
ncbi:hypothetical protein O3P69_009495 [Scylla paramamosain]|uniref:Uncharacterized protein n=1 Tax=Scylla paramamosain TaxID=85552 RepID=A0AAW0STS4_SCYPA